MHCAAVHGNVPTMEALYKLGASRDAKNLDGDTPIHLATKGGHEAAVEALFVMGANGDAKNYAGKSPLDVASSRIVANWTAIKTRAIAKLCWDSSRTPPAGTLSDNNMTIVKSSGGSDWNCNVISNMPVDRFAVKVNNKVNGSTMVGFSKGESWNMSSPNYDGNGVWYMYLYNGTLYGNGASNTSFSSSVATGDLLTFIREGTKLRIEKNKVSLGICNFPTPLLDKPLFAAMDICDVNSSLTLLLNDFVELPKSAKLLWDSTKIPVSCTLSEENTTLSKTSGNTFK